MDAGKGKGKAKSRARNKRSKQKTPLDGPGPGQKRRDAKMTPPSTAAQAEHDPPEVRVCPCRARSPLPRAQGREDAPFPSLARSGRRGLCVAARASHDRERAC